MIRAEDAIGAARGLIGTPYAELDCINLIKKVIRDAPGGVKGYTTAGTNTLWRSYDQAAKYRDLTWRQEGLDGAKAGMLAFKAKGDDYHHVGIVTRNGTVIHSSSTQGGRGVVETELTSREGWTHLAKHRLIMTKEADEEVLKTGRVSTQGGRLNVRKKPQGSVIDRIENGSAVRILDDEGVWLRVEYGEGREGYVSSAYIKRDETRGVRLRIADRAGNVFEAIGGFSVEVLEEEQ